MTFLAPLWLLAAALGGIVLLLHASRRREVAVPSLQLWRLLGTGAARRRVRRWPPLTAALLLQLLAVALAALALAQPRIVGTTADHFVFVLDSSGSMRATDAPGSRFDAARADLETAIATLAADGDIRVSVVLAGATPRLVVARQTRVAGMLPLVEALEAGDGGGDWPTTFATLEALLEDGETARVTVLTDDAAGAAAGAAAVLPPGLPVETVRYGRPDTPDAALAARLVAVDAGAGRWRIEGTITLGAGAPLPAEVAVAYAPGPEGGLLDWPPIVVRPPRAGEGTADSLITVPFGGELELPAAGRLRLALPGDAGVHNDAVFLAVPATEALRVLIVGPADDDLLRALAAVGPIATFVADRLPADLRDVDLVVVTGVVERRPEINVLWLGQGRIAGEPAPAHLAVSDPTLWDAIHPLSRNINWAALEGPAAFGVPDLPGADILLAAGNAPLLQARTTGSGREIRLALDLAGSPFADSAAFPVLVANIAAWLGQAPGPCIAGLPCPLAALDLAASIEAPDGRPAWTGIDTAAALPAGVDRAFIPTRSGFHTAIRSDGTTTTYVVNAPPEEDGIAVTGSAGGSLPAPPLRLGGWLAGAVFVALLAEAVVSGRGRERFLRRTALRAGSPGARRRRMLLAIRVFTLAAVLAGVLAAPLPVREPAEMVFAVTVQGQDGAAPFAAAATQLAEDGRATWLSAASGDGQNLEDAIRLAAAMLPADRAGRIVIGSDGNETSGAIGAALPGLLARGIRLDAEPLPAMPAGEVLAGRVEAGSHVRAGDSFPLSALVWSQSGGEAALAILRDGEPAVSETAVLRAGWNRIDTVMPATEGPTLVEVTVSSAGDVFPQNNRNGTIIVPDLAPRILVLSSDMDWGNFFATALRAQNLSADVISPDRAPRALAGWLAWDVVVLMNMPALSLTTAQQELLEEAVRDHGRGLVILGGERAFGPGGYYATALERLSPLSSRVPQETPRSAIVFVLDRSGSMQAPVDDLIRLDIAKEATLGAVMLLNEESEVGIVVFDSEAQVLVPMQRPREEVVRAALAPLEPGGGTALFPALTAALGMFEGVTAETRHIVVITDGLVEPVDFSALLREIVAAGITVSTVAVGTSAITDKLASIAADGGGAYHATADFKALPGILAQEAMYRPRRRSRSARARFVSSIGALPS
ncbi:MAG: VWA domain-containing protein [Bauldia sp.]|nr:VWA domain-containing protein [Bauldia sp.]